MPLKNEVRIIGGKWKRRKLRFPDRPTLRPTLDRVRVTLFNWLIAKLDDAVCLDLYAGSGALGFEAASRGARAVTLVERDAVVVRALEDNRQRLGASNVTIVRGTAAAWLERTPTPFDVVFVDLRLHPHLAELHVRLVLLRLTVLLRLLVLVAAEVHQAGDGRVGLGGDFDEVHAGGAGHRDRLGGLYDADLVAVLVDQSDFRHTDALVDPWFRRCGLWWWLWSFPQTAPQENANRGRS